MLVVERTVLFVYVLIVEKAIHFPSSSVAIFLLYLPYYLFPVPVEYLYLYFDFDSKRPGMILMEELIVYTICVCIFPHYILKNRRINQHPLSPITIPKYIPSQPSIVLLAPT